MARRTRRRRSAGARSRRSGRRTAARRTRRTSVRREHTFGSVVIVLAGIIAVTGLAVNGTGISLRNTNLAGQAYDDNMQFTTIDEYNRLIELGITPSYCTLNEKVVTLDGLTDFKNMVASGPIPESCVLNVVPNSQSLQGTKFE